MTDQEKIDFFVKTTEQIVDGSVQPSAALYPLEPGFKLSTRFRIFVRVMTGGKGAYKENAEKFLQRYPEIAQWLTGLRNKYDQGTLAAYAAYIYKDLR